MSSTSKSQNHIKAVAESADKAFQKFKEGKELNMFEKLIILTAAERHPIAVNDMCTMRQEALRLT